MKNLFLILAIVSFNNILLSQIPFSTPVREPIALKEVLDEKGNFKEYVMVEDTVSIKNILDGKLSELNEKEIVVSNKGSKLGFFKNNSLSANIIGDKSRYSINSEVMFFKLYVASPSKDFYKKRKVKDKSGKTRDQTNEEYENRIPKYRFNLPLMLITKLSTSYDSISSSNAIDALDYEGSPITLRIMPSYTIDFNNYNDRIDIGFYSDLRGLNLADVTITNSNNLEFVGTFGAGFTYHGDGEAGTYNEEGNYEKGKYAISAMFQVATGKAEVIQGLFDTNKKYSTSFQGYFLYNSIGETKFNLKVGYQYFFDKTIGGARSNFNIGISN